MKKIFLGLLAVMVSATVLAEHVTPEDAALVANHFMNAEATSVAGVKKAAKPMVRKATAETAQYYVYENANGEGWVIVAANDAVTPILAYSTTGQFRTDNMPSNIRKWMSHYDKFIQKVEADGLEASEETQAQWKKLRKGTPHNQPKGNVVVAPLVQSTWDQDAPYWNLCPGTGSNKAYTGCVATSMAQVMNFWQWPEKGIGSHSYKPLDPNTGQSSKRYTSTLTVNFGETTYDWQNMKNSYSGSYTDAEATAVATLMYHCGVGSEMMYGNDADGGSGTMTVNYGDWTWGITTTNEGGCAQNALYTFFGYKKPEGYMRDGYTEQGYTYYEKWSDTDWTAMVKDELSNKRPIMYGGESSEGGHSFICDGYDDQDYFHFNWGWSGSNDGWYKLSNLVPGSGGAGGGGYDFSENQDVLIGIVPDKTDWPTVTVTWSVNGVATPVAYKQHDALKMPAAPADCEGGKVFVGWTKQSSLDGNKPTDLFTSAGYKAAVEDVTYYAVYADKEEGDNTPAEVASVTFKTAENDATQEISDFSKVVASSTGIASYSGSKVYQGKEGIKLGGRQTTGSITLTLPEAVNVSKVVVNASKYGSDTGKLKVTAGSTELGSAQSPAANLEFTTSTPVETNTITIATTSKRAYVASITVIAGGGTSYSDYAIGCEGSQDVELVGDGKRANKVIENGQLIIIRGDEKYSIFGQKIQ